MPFEGNSDRYLNGGSTECVTASSRRKRISPPFHTVGDLPEPFARLCRDRTPGIYPRQPRYSMTIPVAATVAAAAADDDEDNDDGRCCYYQQRYYYYCCYYSTTRTQGNLFSVRAITVTVLRYLDEVSRGPSARNESSSSADLPRES